MYYSGIFTVILFLTASFLGLDYLWGMNIWSFYGIPFSLAISLISILLLSEKSFNAFDKLISKIKTGKNEIALTLILSIVLFIVFKQEVFFLGDGFLRIKNMEALQYFSSGSPVGNYFSVWLYDKIFKSAGFSAEFVWRFISYCCGIISTLIYYYYGKKIFDDKKTFILCGLILFSSAVSQLYFGYVESYTLYYTLLLGYFLSTLYLFKSLEFSFSPAIFIISAFLVSPTAVIFSPAVLFAYYKASFGGSSKKPLVVFIKPIILVVIITILAALILNLLGFEIEAYKAGLSKVDHILDLLPSKNDQGIIDVTHLNDIINQILLTAPLIAVLPFIKSKNIYKKSTVIFLIINFVSALLFALIFRADISFVRDWDLFSILAYPLIFIVIMALSQEKNYYGMYVSLILLLMVSIPFILLNSSEKLSLKRMVSITEINYLPDYAKSSNFDVLRQYFSEGIHIENPSTFKVTDENRERIENALYFSKLAYDFEKNERQLYNLALYAFILKKYEDAKEYLFKLNNSNFPNKHLGFALLSKIYISESKIHLAIEEIKKIEKMFPESETVKLDIANLYYSAGEPSNSYEYFKKAFVLNSENSTTLDYLIELSYLVDSKKQTIEYYHIYNKIKPGNALVFYNIAVCFSELKMIDSMKYYSEIAEKNGISKDMINKLNPSDIK